MVLKGTSAVRQSLDWTLAVKVRLYGLVKNDEVDVREAFETVATENGWTLPKSYVEHPHSHFYRIRKELEKGITKSDETVIAALRAANLITD